MKTFITFENKIQKWTVKYGKPYKRILYDSNAYIVHYDREIERIPFKSLIQ